MRRYIWAVEAFLGRMKREIEICLKERMKGKDFQGYVLNTDAGWGKGDYACYRWIQLENREDRRAYWITLFYNDYDAKSLNVHTVLGKVQFWREIFPHGSQDKSWGPNERGIEKYPKKRDCRIKIKGISKEEGMRKILNKKEIKAFNPEQNVFDDDFNMDLLVDDFLTFIQIDMSNKMN